MSSLGDRTAFSGPAWAVGDEVNTDLIFPGRWLTLDDPRDIAAKAMSGMGPEWEGRLRPGDILVAGRNFGCGSSREQAASALKYAGVSAVVAVSFGRIFFRNAVNHGLPVLECPDALSVVESGASATVDLDRGVLVGPRGSASFRPLPPFLLDLLRDGGLLPSAKRAVAVVAAAAADEAKGSPSAPRPRAASPAGPRPAAPPQTMAQKILARNVGRPSVDVGEILDVVPDRLMSASATTQLVVKYFREMGATRVFDPERIVLVLDHETPAFSVAGANAHKVVRAFAAEQGIRAFHDLGEGICHQLMIEKGHVRAGSVVLGKDSHSTSYGCAAALGIPVGALEMASVFATGRLWLRVPETIRVVVDGALPPAVFAKDLVLLSAREIRSDGAQYRSIEYLGEGVRGLSMSERFTLANMAVEMGAKCAALPFDEVTRAWALATGDPDPVAIVPDEDAAYVRTVRLDASTLEPMIAVPHNIDSVFPLRERAGTHVDQAFLGSCTNSRLDDLEVAARVLRGRRVHPGTRLVVGAASKDVYVAAMRLGLMADFVEAGAIVIPPGCGPCYGGHQGILGDGEVCISASNRNFRGRMGNANAQVYLASPAAVAAAAVAGEITDPTPFLREGS